MTSKNKYGLLTCITMIVGVVIGSGIFFKSDDILVATNGNIFLGALAFCIAAISIIFGSLTVAELAARTDKPGGPISYAEDAYNGGIACALGWFQVFLYYPTLIAVVCYVVGIYTCILFGLSATLELQILIGLIATLIIFLINILSAKLAGLCQNVATFIKLIPLLLIGIAGFIFGDPSSAIEITTPEFQSATWLSALIPIVFAFDGWIVSTAISHEVKNAKRNIPIALIFSPLLVLIMYLLYFIGISIYLGPETIIATKDAHVELVATQLFGPWSAKALIIFVIISVAGTANGLTMGLSRLPYSLAIRNMFPNAKKVSSISKRLDIPLYSYLIALGITLFWLAMHYITTKFNILGGSDVSEISTTLNYVLFILLYVHVLRLGIKGEIKSFWKGKVNPIFAILGSLIILYVGMQNPLFIFYISFCSIILVIAYRFWKKSVA